MLRGYLFAWIIWFSVSGFIHIHDFAGQYAKFRLLTSLFFVLGLVSALAVISL